MKYLVVFCLLLGLNSAYSAPKSSGFFTQSGPQSVPQNGSQSGSQNGSVNSMGGSNAPTLAEAKVYSRIPEANALYIQGLEYLSKGDSRAVGSMLSTKKALELFRQAAKKDPQFALAYVGQANAIDILGRSVSGGMAPIKVYRQQKAAALKAAALDDSLPQAHDQLASIYYDNEYDWPKAEKERKRVIELTPNDVLAHTRYSFFLGSMGRFEEAEAQVKLAQTIDEKNAAPNRAMSRILYWQHKDDAAVAQGLEALRKDDNLRTHFYLAYVYIHKGQFDKGIEEMKLASFNDADSLAALAFAYAMAGNKTELESTLERLKHHPSHAFYGLAQVHAALGDKNRAISLLEKAYQERSNRMNYLKVDPAFDILRQEPQFKQLMRKMNFEQ
jgi:tetratricopeptide (TPR) repeat protein